MYPLIDDEEYLVISKFTADQIIESYSSILKVDDEMRNEFFGFEVRRNAASGLVYCWPMRPGSRKFYQWITEEEKYYPKFREEWEVISRKLSHLSEDNSLLDIGCGNGRFLDYLKHRSNISLRGLDTTMSSVETCRSKGHNVIFGDLRSMRKENPRLKFDAITMTHLLEHVPDPVGLSLEARELLAPGGQLFISVPGSPLSWEYDSPDPKNLPPHHLTRWSPKALQALAMRLDMAVSLNRFWSHSIHTAKLIVRDGIEWTRSYDDISSSRLSWWIRRCRENGGIYGDLLLATLSN